MAWIFIIVILIFSVILHEIAQGAMASHLGDQTAKHAGRLTLNPVKHIDPVGSILVPLILVFIGSGIVLGWAKPVPVNPYNLKDKKYALTLHSGANLMTSFVVTDQIDLYFSPENWKKEILGLRQQLDLKELVRGGNVRIIRPVYKNSVFYGARTLKVYKVVSNLQLYIDLYNFKPRGREHAEYLKKAFEEKGKSLYES